MEILVFYKFHWMLIYPLKSMSVKDCVNVSFSKHVIHIMNLRKVLVKVLEWQSESCEILVFTQHKFVFLWFSLL